MLNIDYEPCGVVRDPHGRVYNLFRVGGDVYLADAKLVGKLKRPPQDENYFYFAGRLYPKSVATHGNNP